MRQLDAGRFREAQHVEVGIGSNAGRRVIQFAGILLCPRDQLRHGAGRKRRRRDQHVRNLHEFRDAHEIVRRLGLHHAGERALVDRVGGHVADQQRIAVGRGLRLGVERNVPRCACTILDHEGLAERLLELRRELARDDVGRAAGRIRYQQLHRPAGIGLALGDERGRQRGTEEDRQSHEPLQRT